MNKAKSWAVVVAAMGVGLLVWWASPAFRPHPASTTSPAKAPAADKPQPAQHPSAPGISVPEASSATPAVTTDWEARLQRIVNHVGKVPPGELDMEIEDLASGLPDEEKLVVLNLQLLPDAEKMPVINSLCVLLFQRWVERDPAEAAQWLARVPEGQFSRTAYRQVATAWADANLAKALEWLKQLPDNGNKAGAQLAVAAKAAEKTEAVTAIELLTPLPSDVERDRLLKYSALRWATKDRESAAAWAGQMPDSALRENILGQIAIDWAVTDPAKGAAFALAMVPAGKNQENAVATSVRNWAVNTPEQAATWAQQLPEGALRNAALESVAEVWAKQNLAKAAEWLNQLPAGPSRDTAVGMYAATLASTSPEQAARWADTIQNEALRAQVRAQLKSP